MQKKAIASSIIAIISGLLGITGSLGLCCTITGALILSSLGIASMSGYLVYYNKWFYAAAVVFSFLAIYYYLNINNIKSVKNNINPCSKEMNSKFLAFIARAAKL